MQFTRYILAILFILTFSATNSSLAQEQQEEADFKISIKSIEQYAIISLELKNDAVFYWRNPGELGLPTKFNFEESKNLKEAKIFWPVPKIIKKENINSYGYDKNVDFVIKLTPNNSNNPIQYNAAVSFCICQQSCTNYEVNLSTEIQSNYSDKIPEPILNLLANAPKNNGHEGLTIKNVTQELIDNQFWLEVEFISDKSLLEPKVFFDLPEYVNFEPTRIELISKESEQIIRLPFTITNPKHHLINDKIYLNLVADNNNYIEYETIPINKTQATNSFLWIIFCAFLGGLILNFMPCVLPILALKVLQLSKLAGKEQKIFRNSLLAQSFGIIISFIAFALVTYILQFFGHNVGLGMHFQQPIYLITMIIILSFVAINLLSDSSLYIPIPNFIYKFMRLNSDQTNVLEFFISGILTTLLAIPCTAPFVTVAVGFALTTSFIEMILIFICLGIGMSLPYLALALFPQTSRFIPKPGNWLNSFKKILGIIIFATCLWLLDIISSQLGIRAAIILFLLIIVIKFIFNESEVLTTKTKAFIIIILISLCYFLPYNVYIENNKEEVLVEQVWQEYQPEEIPSLIQKGYVVVLDVTASWCATCRLNKLTTLNNASVISAMQKLNIIAMRADISKTSDPRILILMKTKHHPGVPLNIIYSKYHPQGVVLPTLLTPHKFLAAIKSEMN